MQNNKSFIKYDIGFVPCKAEFNHWTARKVSDSCVREGEHRFEFGGHSLIV